MQNLDKIQAALAVLPSRLAERMPNLSYAPQAALQADEAGFANSPCGDWTVFCEKFNLHLKNRKTGEIRALTTDGVKHFDYGGRCEGDTNFVRDTLNGVAAKSAPRVLWSQCGSRFATFKLDQRLVPDLHLLQSCPPDSIRPKVLTYKYQMGGDTAATAQIYIGDTDGNMRLAQVPPATCSLMPPINGHCDSVAFSADGTFALYCTVNADFKRCCVYRIDAATGEAAVLFTETADTFYYDDFYRFIHAGKVFHITEDGGSFLWLSQQNQDGYFHLYQRDCASGEMIRQLTSGTYNVRKVHQIRDGRVFVSVSGLGRNPYEVQLCAIDINTAAISVLTRAEGNHEITFAPDGDSFFDCHSAADKPSVVRQHGLDGTEIAEISRCNPPGDFVMPIQFVMPTADAKHEIYGILLLPPDIPDGAKVPLIEHYYGGPQNCNVPHNFRDFVNKAYLQSFVKLGFACIVIDGRGTPLRSKAFHDYCYQNLGDCAGLPDHVHAIKQICKQYPVIDPTRIGVWGHSGGGYAVVNCLAKYPEIYAAGVASAGNHYQELYINDWAARFMGEYDAELWWAQSVEPLMERITGELLLIHGEMDDNVHPAAAMRLADALIKAGKLFEMLIVPNMHHGIDNHEYFAKKIFDFFIRRL